jgi:hypothetical protein
MGKALFHSEDHRTLLTDFRAVPLKHVNGTCEQPLRFPGNEQYRAGMRQALVDYEQNPPSKKGHRLQMLEGKHEKLTVVRRLLRPLDQVRLSLLSIWSGPQDRPLQSVSVNHRLLSPFLPMLKSLKSQT